MKINQCDTNLNSLKFTISKQHIIRALLNALIIASVSLTIMI